MKVAIPLDIYQRTGLLGYLTDSVRDGWAVRARSGRMGNTKIKQDRVLVLA